MKKIFQKSLAIGVAVSFLTGCSYKIASTPAVMSYDGSNVDYSQIDSMKHAKVCQYLADGEGDTTIIAAAKKAQISKVKHVDTSFEYEKFLFFTFGQKKCVTVYGE